MWISLLLLLSAAARADTSGVPVCLHQSQTAKVALAALYTAEKGFYAEHESYSQNLLEIGMYEPTDSFEDCDWKYWSVKAYLRGRGFVGVARSLMTGETWEIDETREIRRR